MLAQEEAKKFRHNYVGTEHLLLGILEEGDNIVLKTLQEMGLSLEQLKLNIEEKLEYGTVTAEYRNIPFTQQAKQVLSYAWDEARKLGHNYVNVEHVFLAVYRDPTNIAARILTETGVSQTEFKDALFAFLGNKAEKMPKQKREEINLHFKDFGRWPFVFYSLLFFCFYILR